MRFYQVFDTSIKYSNWWFGLVWIPGDSPKWFGAFIVGESWETALLIYPNDEAGLLTMITIDCVTGMMISDLRSLSEIGAELFKWVFSRQLVVVSPMFGQAERQNWLVVLLVFNPMLLSLCYWMLLVNLGIFFKLSISYWLDLIGWLIVKSRCCWVKKSVLSNRSNPTSIWSQQNHQYPASLWTKPNIKLQIVEFTHIDNRYVYIYIHIHSEKDPQLIPSSD